MINHILNKIQMILSAASGWISLLGTIVANFFAGCKLSVSLVLLLVFLDLGWGIASSIKRGAFARSELARESVSKFAVYGCCIIASVALDKLIGITFSISTISICALIMLVEMWSMAGSMLIVFPNMPFLKIIRPILLGEIANKLGVSVDEAKQYLGKEV